VHDFELEIIFWDEIIESEMVKNERKKNN